MSSISHGDLCVLFGDVSGSTRLYEKLGDTEALQAVGLCLSCMKQSVTAYNGRVVKTIGDELMVVFDSAENSFYASCDMQTRVEKLPHFSGLKLAIRIGFHFGPVLLGDDGDVFGDTVNMAARMVELAKSGQIMTTDGTLTGLPRFFRNSTRPIHSINIKGKADAVAVNEVLWQDSGDLTIMGSPPQISEVRSVCLRLIHNGAEIVLAADFDSVTIGRNAESDVVIFDPRASRNHCKIERRRDKFFLVDQSTNGTYLNIEGGAEFILKHEDVVLNERGSIAFGHAYLGDDQEVVNFEVLIPS